jgi:hypothetical protein
MVNAVNWLDTMIRSRTIALLALFIAPLGACNTVETTSVTGSANGSAGSFASLASPADPKATKNKSPEKAGGYYVEFRSRYAASYGHTFLIHGRLNAKGDIGEIAPEMVAGLHPATESPVPWMIGHVMPVISETGASDGDTEEKYVSARFRVNLSEPEYRKVAAFIEERQRNSPLWHAVLYNCNAWVGDVARFMGLEVPANTLQFPQEFITALRDMNPGADAKVAAGLSVSSPQ